MPPNNLTGKIKSVSCWNFVTYNECTFKPNAFLNVIIGPNGTGKSTLVAAIVIGFGGDPKLLNRSTSIQDYIKNGKTSAKVVIEIYETNNKDSIMRLERNFNSAGKSEFKVNNEQVSKSKFLAAVANFKIQIGNLCQFLPQDRVHDFAKMNPQELFANTIKSVCSQEEIQIFDELKAVRSDQSSRKDTLARHTQNLRVTTARVEELKVTLERYTQRKEYLDKLKVFTAKQTWLEVEEIEKKLKAQSADKVEADKILKKVERELSTVKRQQDAITQTKTKLRTDVERKRSAVTKNLEEFNDVTKQLEDLTNQIKSSKRSLELSKRESGISRQEVISETAILEGMAQDLKNMSSQYGSIQGIKNQLNPLNERIYNYRNEISKRMEKCASINNRLDTEYIGNIQMLKSRIDRANNVSDSKLQFLRTKFPDVYTAVQWLQENRNRFRGNVYNPILLELNVKTANYAKYAENTINFRDLLAFTCEDKLDMSFLTNELCTNQKLKVSILYSAPAICCNYRANVPIQNLSQYGFDAYLIDTLEGPPSIINYLCSLYNIHRIPIGGDRVGHCIQQMSSNIRLFYGGNNRFDKSVSKYSGETSLTQSHIQGKNLLISVDMRQVEAMKKELSKLLQESDALKNNCTKIQSEIKDIEVESEEVRKEKRSIESHLIRIKETIGKFERQKEKIERLKANITSIPEAEKKFLTKAVQIVKNLLELEKKHITWSNAYQNALAEKKIAEIKVIVYNQQSEDLESCLRAINERRNSARQTYENISRAIAISERKCKDKALQAKQATNGCSPNDRNFPYKREFAELPQLLTELREQINEFNARLECMSDVDESAIKEYEEKSAEIEMLKSAIIEIQTQEHVLETKIVNMFNDWYSNIERIVGILNQQFSGFMTSMGYVGEVSLTRKDNYDFDSYGIQIMVQYRKEVPLQALDRSRQSGGERAVAIAVYSLSLQHITHVPFRCVDEINQGMDSRNERKIFEMLVEETTQNGRSQYFFVTPKLLPGLMHNKRMMVHIVFNGKFVRSNCLT